MIQRVTLLLLLCPAGVWAGQPHTAPDWAQELATRSLPAYPPEVASVGLLSQENVTVLPDGSTTSDSRHAVRILTPEGKGAATAFIRYFPKVTKIKEFKAWLITADGSTKVFEKNDILDIALQANFELYSDQRAKLIGAENATPGSTFVWTAQVEDQPLFPQIAWTFQSREPALLSRFVLTLPAGWQATAVTFNHNPIQPTVDGNTTTWELKDLEHIKRERGSPQAESLAPWIGVNYYSAANAKAPRDWRTLSLEQTNRDEAQTASSEELVRQVKQLTAGQNNSLDQIRAIGRFVQNLKYVAISTDLAHGGGYLPHPASQVLEKGYGDCKDKANLMRTMLRQLGVQSYMVAVFPTDRNHVHPEWASVDQFDHMILAIKVPDDTFLPAVTNHPALGKLLIFDSTDPYTPVGLLPEGEQGSYGLLLAGDKGGSIQLPVAPPDTNRTDVAVSGTLSPDGGLNATLVMKNRAATARRFRALKDQRQAQFDDDMRGWLQRNVKELEANKVEANDSFDNDEMDLNFDFKAPRYAQLMQGRLLMFRPSIVQPFFGFPLQSEKRLHPLELNGESYHKEVRVKLPDSVKVDELPDAASFSSSFGKYSAECKVAGSDLVYTEDLTVSTTTVPADQYKEARDFFAKIVGAEKAPLVLVRN